MVEKFQRKWKGEAAQKAQAIANPPPKKTRAQVLREQQTIAAQFGAPKTVAPATPPAAKPVVPAAAKPAAPVADPSKKA